MSKHTPGPWPIAKHSRLDKTIDLPMPGISIDNDDVDHDEAEANARLVSAAPALLAIGQRLLEIFDHPTRSVTALDADALRAAITAATGEGP